MKITLPLNEMSTSDKLITMENIWNDLCQHADEIPSPSWHGKVLKQRENDLKNGKDSFTDWEDAKRNIREAVS